MKNDFCGKSLNRMSFLPEKLFRMDPDDLGKVFGDKVDNADYSIQACGCVHHGDSCPFHGGCPNHGHSCPYHGCGCVHH